MLKRIREGLRGSRGRVRQSIREEPVRVDVPKSKRRQTGLVNDIPTISMQTDQDHHVLTWSCTEVQEGTYAVPSTELALKLTQARGGRDKTIKSPFYTERADRRRSSEGVELVVQ